MFRLMFEGVKSSGCAAETIQPTTTGGSGGSVINFKLIIIIRWGIIMGNIFIGREEWW